MAPTQTTAPMTATDADSVSGQRAGGSWIRRVLFRLMALGLGAVVALLAVEIGLRLSGWAAPGFYRDGRGPLPTHTPSADGGYWRTYPGASRHRHYDYDIPIQINRHGFRERDNLPKVPGEWRIGLFGDSMTAGNGVVNEQRFGEVWLDAIHDQLPNATLWNFGSPWCGSWQNAAFLATGAQEYELDEIVLAIFSGNELADNAKWSTLRELSPAELRKYDARRDTGLRRWLRNHCRLATFVWINAARTLASRDTSLYVSTRQDVVTHWPHTERALAAFRHAVGDRPLTIWYLPAVHEWDNGIWQILKDKHDLGDGDRFAVRDRLQQWAKANNVPMVDATLWLTGKPASVLQFPVDPHWNAKGHRLVGEGLAGSPTSYHLRSNRLLLPSPKDRGSQTNNNTES